MRRFHSYGPVDARKHFTVSRKELVRYCADLLIGDPDEGGHYFTIWAPRQTGKTWLMNEAIKQISDRYGDRFAVLQISLGKLRKTNLVADGKWGQFDMPLPFIKLIRRYFPGNPEVENWDDFTGLFSKKEGLWDRPLILCIDEVDTAAPEFLDILVSHFREMYLDRERNCLHGLALTGVRAVLGVESERGSPFNIQRSLHVPNLTWEETQDLFRQYQEESGQTVTPEVVQGVFDVTRGQPGLVGWFGELLTEKYNPGTNKSVDLEVWNNTFRLACVAEWNNTVMNLIKKAKEQYLNHILELFAVSDIPFAIDSEWCGYLYLNGVIDKEGIVNEQNEFIEICRFANPFIQRRLYNALSVRIVGERSPILALEPLDRLTDVFDKTDMDIPALLERYKGYLRRLKAKGINPWKDQPRRSDLHYTEYVGHFHLYFWLQNAIGKRCTVSPEFPAGNGRVDLHIRCNGRQAVIEVKSYKDQDELEDSKEQAVRYARQLNMPSITLAVFAPVEDDDILNQLSGESILNNVRVVICAIGWV